eukprot:4495269-Amphidinium_carterae.1
MMRRCRDIPPTQHHNALFCNISRSGSVSSPVFGRSVSIHADVLRILPSIEGTELTLGELKHLSGSDASTCNVLCQTGIAL